MTSEQRGLNLLASLQDGNKVWQRSRQTLLKVSKLSLTVKVFEVPQVKLEWSASGQGWVKKEKYTIYSLSFSQGSANILFTQCWCKVFKPSLIFWALCQDDPFGTNALLDTVIEELWKRIFPSVASTYEESKATICQVISLSLWLLINAIMIDAFSLSRLVMCLSIGKASWGRKGSL